MANCNKEKKVALLPPKNDLPGIANWLCKIERPEPLAAVERPRQVNFFWVFLPLTYCSQREIKTWKILAKSLPSLKIWRKILDILKVGLLNFQWNFSTESFNERVKNM